MGNQQARLKQLGVSIIQKRDQNIKQFLPTLQKLINQSGISNEQIKQISSKTATQLVQLLNNNKVTSKQLVQIFTYRSLTVGIQLKLITQFDYDNAIRMAQKCDDQRSLTKKRNWTFGDEWDLQKFLPPLYGIPISVKDLFDMKGTSSTLGLTEKALKKSQSDNNIITCFRSSGLIPFVRSNVPQFCFTVQCGNFLWGRAENIWNRDRTVGGSSGGQSGLLAANCSPIGIGTDIGGSVRIPAQFCGIYALKISNDRLSMCGTTLTIAFYGKNYINPVMGPMGKSVDDLALWMKTTTCEQFYKGQHDVFNKLHLFDQKVYLKAQKPKKLRIGYFKNLNFVETTKASLRALDQVKTKLESLGHQLVQIKLPNEDQIILAYYAQCAAQGKARLMMDLLGKQQLIPELTQFIKVQRISSVTHSLVKNVFKIFQPRLSRIMAVMRQKTVYQYLFHGGMIQVYRKQVIDYWKENKLDFIICPGFGAQAFKHGMARQTTLAVAYTFIWNLLNLPVGSVPVTVVRNDQQVYESRYDDMITRALIESAQGSMGLPVGIQIVGLPYQEQKILGLMKVVQECVKFSQNYKAPQL